MLASQKRNNATQPLRKRTKKSENEDPVDGGNTDVLNSENEMNEEAEDSAAEQAQALARFTAGN